LAGDSIGTRNYHDNNSNNGSHGLTRINTDREQQTRDVSKDDQELVVINLRHAQLTQEIIATAF